MPEFKPILQE